MDCFNDVVRVVAREDEPAVVLELFNERPEGFLRVLGEVVCFVEEDDFLFTGDGGAGGELSDCGPYITNATIETSVDEKEISAHIMT